MIQAVGDGSHRTIDEASSPSVGRYLLPYVIVLTHQLWVTVNVPWSDEWLLLPWLDRQTATGSFSGLWEPLYGHISVGARLVMLGSALLDSLDLGHLKLLGGLALLAAAWVLLRLIGPERGPLVLIPCALTLFSLRQWENLDWGMQSSVFVTLLLAVLAVRFLHDGNAVGSLLAATGATFGWAGGVMIWPALALQAFVSRPRSRSPWIFAGGAIAFGLWLGGGARFSFPVLGAVLYVLRNVAGSLVSEGVPNTLQLVIGAAVAASYVPAFLTFFRASADDRRAALPFLSLIVFALLNTATFVAARYAAGYDQPGASRYSSVTLLGPVGALLVLTLCRGPASARVALGAMMVAGPLYTDFVMFRMAPGVRGYVDNLVRVVCLPTRTPEDLKPFQLYLDRIDPGVEILRRRGWGPMRSVCPEARQVPPP